MSALIKFVLLVLAIHNVIECQHFKSGVGYSIFSANGARHGDRRNEDIGGTCAEFLKLNNLNQCCDNRQDDCYMIHYDTRCYCDVFCDRRESDCCPDAIRVCTGGELTTPIPIITTTLEPSTSPEGDFCEKDGEVYNQGDEITDNCNTCTCDNGHFFCTSNPCLINEKWNKKINSDGMNWKAGNYSKFWGKLLEYGYKRRLGTKLPSEKQKPINPRDYFKLSAETNKEIPDSYDYREDPEVNEFLNKNPIRDQGDCASSWAFSTIDVATDRLVKVTKGKYGSNTQYSVQQLISCVIQKNDKDGCTPSTVDVAWNKLNYNQKNDAGVVEERCYSYANSYANNAKACQINSMKPELIQCPSEPESPNYDGSILLASPAYPLKVESDADIQREILSQGPVQAIFKVYPDFFSYKSGVYEPSRYALEAKEVDPNPYHSVKILGWGNENGTPYWLCANSWGSDWGEDGYFKIKRGVAEIDKNIYAAWGNGKINGKLIFNTKHFNNHVMSMYMSN